MSERAVLAEGYRATPEPTPGHPGTVDAVGRSQAADKLLDHGGRAVEVLGLAAVALVQDRTGQPEVAAIERADHGADALALGHDVAGATPLHRVGDGRQVRCLGSAQWSAEDRCRRRAFRSTIGVTGVRKTTFLARMDDHELGGRGDGHRPPRGSRKVHQDGRSGYPHQAHQWVHEPDGRTGEALGVSTTLGKGDEVLDRAVGPGEGQGDADAHGGAGREPRADWEVALDLDSSTRGRVELAHQRTHQRRPRRLDVVRGPRRGAWTDLEGGGPCIGVSADFERRGSVRLVEDAGSQLDGHG